MKRVCTGLTVLLLIVMITPAMNVKGEEVYSYDDLVLMYEEQSYSKEKIELENQLTQRNYEKYLDEYEILEDGIQQLLDSMSLLNQLIDQTLVKAEESKRNDVEVIETTLGEIDHQSDQLGKLDLDDVDYIKVGDVVINSDDIPKDIQLPDDSDIPDNMELPDEIVDVIDDMLDKYKDTNIEIGIDAKSYYMNLVLPTLMNQLGEAKSIYKELVKEKQLDIYVQMESLKVQTDQLDKLKKQSSIKEINRFKERLYDYELSRKKIDLLHSKKRFLEKELMDLENQYELGEVMVTDMHLKELEIMNVEQMIKEVNNDNQKLYNTIIYDLKLEPEVAKIVVNIDEPEVIEPMSHNDFAKIVISQNVDLLMLTEQLRLYGEMENIAKEVFREGEAELNIILIKKAIQQMNIEKNKQLIHLAIKNRQADYERSAEKYKIEKDIMGIAQEKYNLQIDKYHLGLMSETAYRKESWNYEEAVYQYNEAITNYVEAYHRYEEALYGFLDMK